jgi:hypothetical protein
MSSWEETAERIAKEAWEECRNNEEEAMNYIYEEANNCSEISYTGNAFDVVLDAGDNDKQTYIKAGDALSDTEGDRIAKHETFDDVVFRMAYWIIATKALDYYKQIIEEEE